MFGTEANYIIAEAEIEGEEEEEEEEEELTKEVTPILIDNKALINECFTPREVKKEIVKIKKMKKVRKKMNLLQRANGNLLS